MNNPTIFDFDNFDEDEEVLVEGPIDESKLFDFLRQNSASKSNKDSVTVYLAGPIEADLSTKNPHSIEWRKLIKALFELDDETVWDVRDPTNGTTDGKNYIKVDGNQHYYNPYFLFRTCLRNVAESDFIVVNLSKASYMFGTPFEMGYAYCKDIPIICICEPGVIPEHPFITQSVDAFVYSEEEAVNLIKFMLQEDV